MSDLISRKETIKYIRENLPLSTFMHRGVKQADIACLDVCNMIADRVPSAESERMKGKWIEGKAKHIKNGEIRNVRECSVCGSSYFIYDRYNSREETPKYCPNCGADMRAKENENV